MSFLQFRASTGLEALSLYFGNPNAIVTSIDVSGGITCSRTSGKTPCFIHVSASAITAVGTSWPYEDLHYEWNFGDPSGTETLTNPGVGGGTVNANSDQTGPEAVYCYRSAGTYTVTLTVRGKNGASTAIRRTVTQAITVSAFGTSGGEYWFDSVAGSDANDGLSIGAPKQTLSALNTIISNTNNRTVHIKRGSSYSGTTFLYPFGTGATDYSGLRIDAYGSGAKPQINSTDGASLFIYGGGSGSPSAKDDIVISNIKFSTSGANTIDATCKVLATANDVAAITNVYFDNCDAEIETVNIAPSSGAHYLFQMFDNTETHTQLTKTGLWNCTLLGPQVPIATAHSMGILCSSNSWFFKVGGSITGGSGFGGGASALDHHIYPAVLHHSLYRWIDFGLGVRRNFCINCSGDNNAGGLIYVDYIHVAGCNLTGTDRAVDLDNSPNDPTKSQFRNIVIEKNRVHDLADDDALITFCAIHQTIRYNEVWNLDAGRFIGPANDAYFGGLVQYSIYGNKIYYSASATAHAISFEASNFTQLQTITDNIIQDMRTDARTITVPFTQQAGATIDRNQYYAPNDTTYLYDISTAKTFAQWQAAGFDVNGTVADPGWADPANGDFS